MIRLGTMAFILAFCVPANAQSYTTVQYLANEGVMVAHEETKILFDPLYGNSYGTYQLVPDEMREAIFEGRSPYNGIDAVFISHHHGDHFSAEDMLRYLRSQTDTRLYAPAQAVAAIRELAGSADDALFDRVVGLDLDYGDEPVSLQSGGLVIDAIHIPHSGWPTRRTDVQNLGFRVTLDDNSTVLHLGDADARTIHFGDEDYWGERVVDLALPPYWFFGSDDGNEILETHIDVENSIGIHVPAEFSEILAIPEELLRYEMFTRPGEERRFVGSQ